MKLPDTKLGLGKRFALLTGGKVSKPDLKVVIEVVIKKENGAVLVYR